MNTPEDAPVPSVRKLDIFALPSYTAIIFALIAAVILGIAFTVLLPGSQLWWPPVILGLTLLSLRDFLQWPDRLLRKYRAGGSRADRAADDDPARREIEVALAALAPDRSPELCITDTPVAIESFGTFRRRYVALGRTPAARLARNLASGRRRQPYLAMLCHELAHFANHDMPLAQLSRSLLKMTVLVTAANIWIGLLMVLFVVMVSPEILRPEFWAYVSERLAALTPGFPTLDLSWVLDSLQQQNAYAFQRLQDPAGRDALWLSSSLYLVGALLPFVLVGAVLWLFYWPRLMRVRELYADARSAEMLRDPDAALNALSLHGILTLAPEPETRTPWQHLRDGWSRALWQARGLPMKLPVVGRLFALHPSRDTRERCLADPVRVFGKPHEIAITVGLAAILLDLATRGILTAAYIYEPGPFLPVLIAFVIIAIWLLPQVSIAGRGTRQMPMPGRMETSPPCPPLLRGEGGVDAPPPLQGEPVLSLSKEGWGVGGPLPRQLRRWWGRQQTRLPVQIALIVGVIAAMKLLMHFIDLGLVTFMRLTDAAGWGQALDLWVYVMLGVGAERPLPGLLGVQVTWAEYTAIHVFRPMLYFGLALPPALFGLLWADAALKRRALTWYAAGSRVRHAFWIVTGGLGLLLGLVVIPALNHLLFPEIYRNWSPAAIVGIVLGLLAASVSGIWFWRSDRRWAGRCPSCGQSVTGFYYPGKVCRNEQCGQALHTWLVASY